MQYHVGQIIFIGSNKRNSVVPVQIKRRTIEETIEGNHVAYFVSTPKNATPVNLKKVQGQVFTSLEEAQRTMVSNAERTAYDFLEKAKKQIAVMVNAADKASRKFPQVGGHQGQQGQQQQHIPEEPIELDPLDISPDDEASYQDSYQESPYQESISPENEENVIMVPDPSDSTGKKKIPVRVNSLSMSQKKEE